MTLPTLDGTNISFIVAYTAGVVTFFASCLLPLVPTYLAYITGISFSEHTTVSSRWRILGLTLLFVLGFVTTFVVLGLTLNTISAQVAPIRAVIEKASGIFLILVGLFLLGVFKHPALYREFHIDTHSLFNSHHELQAILLGIAFGFGWSPCIGPVLAVILFWAAQAESASKGMFLLIMYGLGLGTPFIGIALAFNTLLPHLKRMQQVGVWLSRISAVFILLAGILLLTGQLNAVTLLLLQAARLSPLTG